MEQNKEKQLSEDLVALFLLILGYKKSYYYKSLLNKYKLNRDTLKDSVNRIYAKYSVNGELQISYSDLNLEFKKIDKDLKNIAKNLYYTENIALMYLLKNTFTDSYYKSGDILSKYIDVKMLKQLADKVVKEFFGRKINSLSATNRNKINKEKFVNKLKDNIRVDLQFGKGIDVINKDIDELFNGGATVSDRLIGNEIVRVYNGALIESYKDNGIKRVRYNSMMEENTCSECASMHGEIFNIDDVIELPKHVRCKCFYTAIVD